MWVSLEVHESENLYRIDRRYSPLVYMLVKPLVLL